MRSTIQRNRLKIAYVSHYDHYRMGGQKSMLALIENLDRSIYEPYCILPREGTLSQKLKELECPSIFTDLIQIKPKYINKIFSTPSRFRKIINEYGFNIIHPDSPADAFLFGLAKKGTNAKLIWHVRLTGAKFKDKIYERVADGVIGISDACKRRFPDTVRFNRKYVTIFNGVDTEIFTDVDKSNKKRELDIPLNSFTIVFAGVLKESKGIFDIVRAMEIVRQSGNSQKPIFLYMLGKEQKPEIKQKLESLIKEKKLQNTIQLVGQKNNVHEWMQAAEVLVLPSHEGSEGMGRVVFEAMACGAVPVVSNISGVNEAVARNIGFTFEEKNFEDMAEKILNLYSDENLLQNHRKRCRERAVNVFDIRVHAQKVMKFYRKVLNL